MSQILELFSQPVYLSEDKYEINDEEKKCFQNVEAHLNSLNSTSLNHFYLEKYELNFFLDHLLILILRSKIILIFLFFNIVKKLIKLIKFLLSNKDKVIPVK